MHTHFEEKKSLAAPRDRRLAAPAAIAPRPVLNPALPADEAGRGANPFTPDDIALVSWLGDPEAQALLKRLALRPPGFEQHRIFYARTRDEWTSPTGARVEKLRAIRDRVGADILSRCDESGDYALMKAFCATPSVDQAVAGAIAAGRFMRRGLAS